MEERIAILGGIRTPFCRAGGQFSDYPAADMARLCITEALERHGISAHTVDTLILGTTAHPAGAVHMGRVVSMEAGLPESLAATTVNTGGASGMVAVVSAARSLALRESSVAVAAGTESMSSIPVLISGELRNAAKGTELWRQTRGLAPAIPRLKHRKLVPRTLLARSFTDPTCGMTMGETAEVLAREFGIDRESQDEFALMSHQRAAEARSAGRLDEEVMAVLSPPDFQSPITEDDGIRADLSPERLAALKPAFDRTYGTVTAGNSAPAADGAAAVVLTTESKAEAEGFEPLGYIRAWATEGVQPRRMGLGSARAVSELLKRSGTGMSHVGLVELHEAFAAQVIANERVFQDDAWSERVTGRTAVGRIDRDLLNVNGGALALGHPFGASGIRMIVTLLHEMHRRGVRTGLAAMCAGGGQGIAMLLERD